MTSRITPKLLQFGLAFTLGLTALWPGALVQAEEEDASNTQLQEIRQKQAQYSQQQNEFVQQAELSEDGLKDAEARLRKQQAEVEFATRKLDEITLKLVRVKKDRALAMQSAYVNGGDADMFNALLSSGSLSEFLSKGQYSSFLTDKKFSAVEAVDSLLDELDKQRRDLVTKKNALEAQSDALNKRIAEIRAALAANQANLEAARQLEEMLRNQTGNFSVNDRPFLKNNEPVGNVITFGGSGTEHGLGMSQYGAKGFADRGWNTEKILKHYYRGTEISGGGTPSDEYVASVVSGEVNTSWNFEMLKAQAITARSYATVNANQDCTPRTQACGQPTAKAREAVAATKGQVLKYQGQVIAAYFHSTSGGYTENNENVWGGTPLPWLRGVPSPYETESPHWEWNTKSYSKEQMASILNQDSRTAVGTLQTIRIVGRGVSGRVTSMQIVGSSGTKTISGPAFKRIFNNNSPGDEDGLRNTLFGFI